MLCSLFVTSFFVCWRGLERNCEVAALAAEDEKVRDCRGVDDLWRARRAPLDFEDNIVAVKSVNVFFSGRRISNAASVGGDCEERVGLRAKTSQCWLDNDDEDESGINGGEGKSHPCTTSL